MKIEFKQEAKNELEDSYLFYEEQHTGLGEQFKNELDQIVRLILLNPQLFPKYKSNLKKAVMRRFPFILIFEIEKSVIIIYAIFHTSRNPSTRI